MYQSYKMDLAGRPLVVDINRVGKQATDVHSCTMVIPLFSVPQPLPRSPETVSISSL